MILRIWLFSLAAVPVNANFCISGHTVSMTERAHMLAPFGVLNTKVVATDSLNLQDPTIRFLLTLGIDSSPKYNALTIQAG